MLLALLLLIALGSKTAFAAQVPTPNLPTSDYLVGTFYFPAWHLDPFSQWVDNGWLSIDKYPDKKPLLGYYDEGNPEVMDWEIKWASEHGVNFFIFLWDRCSAYGDKSPTSCDTNLGKPITPQNIPMSNALNNGFLHASHKDKMKFSLQLNLQFSTLDDLRSNLMPYLINTYFKQPNYLVVEHKPVIYIMQNLDTPAKANGDPQKVKDMLNIMRQSVKNSGFDDLIIFGHTWQFVNRSLFESQQLKEYGVDYSFSYVTPIVTVNDKPISPDPTESEAVDSQKQSYEYFKNNSPLPFVVTASPFWDSYPYYFNKIGNWYISPSGYETTINNAKNIMSQSSSYLGKRMILVDAWNEYGEGHYLAPTSKLRFTYLQAIRNTLTHKDNTPDYRLPQDLNMGPYDSLYQNYVIKNRKNYDQVSQTTYNFNRPEDFIDVDNIKFDITTTDKLTFGGWIKLPLNSGTYFNLGKPFTASMLINKDGAGHCALATQNNGWYSPGTTVTWLQGNIKPNTWHYLICVYNGLNLSVYIDGNLSKTTTTPISGNLTTRLFHLRLNYSDPSIWASGSISNFLFQNKALSSNEILSLYQNTRPSPSFLADANSDSKVDLLDFGLWKKEYLGKVATKTTDFNQDLTVNLLDFAIWKKEYLLK